MSSTANNDQPSLAQDLDESTVPATVTAQHASNQEIPVHDGEEALESHEVIELQAFIDRKAWIEEKILYLEKLPPVDPFAGAEHLSATETAVPGLATPAELEEWLIEHDRIEKETEIFDSGDLKKLKKFTKAATQRNLSPEDTDLIELTLTTIYALDKLLHLLRDRTDNLDLLGIRLTWEKHRVDAWADRRRILADLQQFLADRARWSPSTYSISPQPGGNESGRLSSSASDTPIGSSAGFSRSTRYKLAELLSRDAAQFASRVTALKHGKVTASGRTLDKLIDESRQPVPEPLLDEQDRVEDKCGKEMESLGRFAMSVVMQWKRADELYVETMKDQEAAQSLIEEVELAKAQHPTGRLDGSFTSRLELILKRLSVRSDPNSASSNFPCPNHVLFPGQMDVNNAITKTLSTELKTALNISREATQLVKQYHASWESVKRADELRKEMASAHLGLASVHERLKGGDNGDDRDDGPPNLNDPACLQPSTFSSYLAMVPSIVEEFNRASQRAECAVTDGRHAHALLNKPGVNDAYKLAFGKEVEQLWGLLQQVARLHDVTLTNTTNLRELRLIWTSMQDCVFDLGTIGGEVKAAMSRQRWRQQWGGDGVPMTPESPGPPPPDIHANPDTTTQQLDTLHSRYEQQISVPLGRFTTSLSPELLEFMVSGSHGLEALFVDLRNMNRLWADIRQQATLMEQVREEFYALSARLDDTRRLCDQARLDVISESWDDAAVLVKENELLQTRAAIRADVETLMGSLPRRIMFVSRHDSRPRQTTPFKVPLPFQDLHLERLGNLSAISQPFDTASLDRAVRSDSNTFAVRLAGDLSCLEVKGDLFIVSKWTREVDRQLAMITDDTARASHTLETQETSFRELASTVANSDPQNREHSAATLVLKMIDLDDVSQAFRLRYVQATTNTRELFALMKSQTGVEDDAIATQLIRLRSEALESTERQADMLLGRFDAFKAEMAYAERENAEQSRLEESRFKSEWDRHIQAQEVQRKREEDGLSEVQRSTDDLGDAEKMNQKQPEFVADDEASDITVVLDESSENPDKTLHAETVKQLLPDPETALSHTSIDHTSRPFEPEPTISEGTDANTYYTLSSKAPEYVDVFGTYSTDTSVVTQDVGELQSRIRSLRKRLKSIGITNVARPSAHGDGMQHSNLLPTHDRRVQMTHLLQSLSPEINSLPEHADDQSVDTQLRSLRDELETSTDLLRRVEQLVKLSGSVALCDSALSDLLEHIDSYPAAPSGLSPFAHVSSSLQSPQEQLSARVAHTKGIVSDMNEDYAVVADDPRAASHHERILRTWNELVEMATDYINGTGSRPSSAHSSGRDSSVSSRSINSKRQGYSKLSVGSTPQSRGRHLSPAPPARRVLSNSMRKDVRSSSQVSHVSNRSVSGPSTSSLFSPTFASRQRTTSLSSSASLMTPPTRVRPRTSQIGRSGSPTLSEVSTPSHLGRSTRSSSSFGTWSRAPRPGFTGHRVSPEDRSSKSRRPYIANPKSKLDVAVGDVVNKLAVKISVEVVADTWKDKSGKYWIGDSDPKLCFCRILRSQTVMVRVGGGWTELSKFIQDHFADSFRLMPDSPQRPGSKSEKWISSSTLLETPEVESSPPQIASSPEPHSPFLPPSFAISTPEGKSTRSLTSGSSPGSPPLVPFQFMRRADVGASVIRPASPPLRTPGRPRSSVSSVNTPARHSVWRP
ncbi:hypothetical protein BD410DRAFT_823579 [Rickenella mellea]|uniref:GAR domain-containing protein n=1 Tax=Rickenella mellea TaxID=50990 RepID=A0A4R5XEJ8_9AGAM|nr:hypothetical protein BD410DRAFT_823579 [Rickenella mellea]